MSNYETSSNNSALAPKTSYSTSQPVDKSLKRVVPAVDLKIMQTEIFGVRNRAAVSANAWPLPILPTPGAAVSIIQGANVATGHTWNRVSSNLPPLHLNWTFPSTCLLDGAGKLIRNPMQFVCELTVAIDGRAFTSGNAISMPADPQPPTHQVGPDDPVSSASSHCRLRERTDSLALSIYRQIHGPKLEDTSSVLLPVCSASSSSAGGRKEARVGAWVSGNGVGERSPIADLPSLSAHRLLPSLLLVFCPIQRPKPPMLEARPRSHQVCQWIFRPPAPGRACVPVLLRICLHLRMSERPVWISISISRLVPDTSAPPPAHAPSCAPPLPVAIPVSIGVAEEISLPLLSPLHPQVLVARPWQPLFALLSRLLGSAPPGDSLPTPSEFESRLLSLAIHQTSDFRLRPMSSTRTQCDPHVAFISSCGLDNTDHFQGYPSRLSSCPMLSNPISLIRILVLVFAVNVHNDTLLGDQALHVDNPLNKTPFCYDELGAL
ncbi:hypothetical protein B0H13DRAFT_2659001, partial [Mycena leptocephala]